MSPTVASFISPSTVRAELLRLHPEVVPVATTHSYRAVDNSIYNVAVQFAPVGSARTGAVPLFQSPYAFGATPRSFDRVGLASMNGQLPIPSPCELPSIGKSVYFMQLASACANELIASIPREAHLSDEAFDEALAERIFNFKENSTLDPTFTSFAMTLAALCKRDARMRASFNPILEESIDEFERIGQTAIAAILAETILLNTASISSAIENDASIFGGGHSELKQTKAFFKFEKARRSIIAALLWQKAGLLSKVEGEKAFAFSRAVYFGYEGRKLDVGAHSTLYRIYADFIQEDTVATHKRGDAFDLYMNSAYYMLEEEDLSDYRCPEFILLLNDTLKLALTNKLLSDEEASRFNLFMENAKQLGRIASKNHNK